MDAPSDDDFSDSESSDEEEFIALMLNYTSVWRKSKRGGSCPGRSTNVERDAQAEHERLWRDYFCESPRYSDETFERRFRMKRSLFVRVMETVVACDPEFEQLFDALGKPGLSTIQKCTAAIRMLAYGCSAVSLDETIRGADSTILYYTKRFCEAVIRAFESEYLREPSRSDIETQLQSSEQRGFPGCLGSLDCMHWQWELCPAAFKGQFQGKEGKPTVVLEVVADKRLWIWHFFFGSAGSNNDIIIIECSPLVNQQILRADIFRSFEFTAAGKQFDQLYYLVDGIYPPYSCFVSTISKPANAKQKKFAECQEAFRKDVERAFGVLRVKFRILKQPSRT
ncbi:hypothetical protein PI124_g14462 [Phytophthora idaei]|nr:hypothetical protein PI125_g20451 [Phytophthora idaei]KAG3131958.1 hypothetical protein PI126_g19842 [Phytophthora idaei]KAG3240640.1 hypothetical protein PI124_g14462 [Phytophthora idaei]